MTAKSQAEKGIREAYCFLRENNTTISSDILDFMLDASLKKLNDAFPVEPEIEKDFFEDFTILRWIKWTKRKPDWNGSVTIRWNSKWTSDGIVHNGNLMKLGDDSTKHKVVKGKLVMQYTKNQKALMNDMYWLEEVHDSEGFRAYQDKQTEEFLNRKYNT
jgi:hypothetical protein